MSADVVSKEFFGVIDLSLKDVATTFEPEEAVFSEQPVHGVSPYAISAPPTMQA